MTGFLSLHVRKYKTVLDYGLHAVDSGIFVSGTWIPDLHLQWGSEFLEPNSGFQIPGFWSPQAKISVIRESRIPYIVGGGGGVVLLVNFTQQSQCNLI